MSRSTVGQKVPPFPFPTKAKGINGKLIKATIRKSTKLRVYPKM